MKEGGLTEAGCRTRQSRVREQLRLHNLDAALLADDRHVYYLTGYWTAPAFRRAVLIERDGPVTLLIEQSTECTCVADDVVKFAGGHQASLVDDQLAAAVMALGTRLKPAMRLGCDQGVPAGLANVRCTADFFPAMLAVRRRKEPDEIALMKRVIAATEAGYERLRQMLRPGVDTLTLYANILAAVAEHAGEFIGELGNDFQIGSGSGAPSRRPAERGEIAVIDLAASMRGYRSDLCRSVVVGGEPTDAQRKAHTRILEVLESFEQTARAGVSCAELHRQARQMLDGYNGWQFKHHLGHGVGMAPHEAPRLNDAWDDTFQVGDVVSVEPGLYGDDLRAGMRVEDMYYITENGLERLSSHSRAL